MGPSSTERVTLLVLEGVSTGPASRINETSFSGTTRDIVLGYDSNEKMKLRMITDAERRTSRIVSGAIEQLVIDGDLLVTDDTKNALLQVFESAVEPALKHGGFLDITEYGRVVHAEMAALLSCSRRGVATANTDLYCTTFPCHNCAKHIVAAGIKRVYFAEPYPKSKAEDLHCDSVSLSMEEGKVHFLPFVGIGPRRYVELFTLRGPFGEPMKRKKAGEIVDWKGRDALPLLPDLLINYLDRDSGACMSLEEKLTERAVPGAGSDGADPS